jgi:hypothetical protein
MAWEELAAAAWAWLALEESAWTPSWTRAMSAGIVTEPWPVAVTTLEVAFAS